MALTTDKTDDGVAKFVLLALASTPVSIATALWLTQSVWQTENGPLILALVVCIFFALPGLTTLVLGALLRKGLMQTLGVAFCIDILGGPLTLIAFGVLVGRSGALS